MIRVIKEDGISGTYSMNMGDEKIIEIFSQKMQSEEITS
jgi:hypothetical protein